MSYGLIYTIPFKSRLNNSFQINIEKDGYSGSSTELQGSGDEVFITDIDEPDNDFRYYPIIASTAKIKLVGNDYLQGLYSNDYQEYRVTLYKDSTIIWCGFIKPENYTQDYNSDLFELDIDCLSSINVLQYIKYVQQGDDEKIFMTFWDVLKYIIDSSKCNYQAIYIPHVYGDTEADYTAYDNVLAKMKVSEANFFDDLDNTTKIITDDDEAETISDENPWKIQSILEEMCRFLNWICVDWNGSLYFIDRDWQGEYLMYNSDLSSYSIIEQNLTDGLELDFAGSDHTLDILPGYNKVTVKTSNYSASDVFPSESFDDLTELETIDYSYNSYRCRKIFVEPDNWNPHLYSGQSYSNQLMNWANITDRNSKFGAQLIKRAIWEVDSSGNPVEKGSSTDYINYSYEDLIQVRKANSSVGFLTPSILRPLFSFSGKLPCVPYADGAICISCSVQLSILPSVNDAVLSFGDAIDKDSFGKYPEANVAFLLKIGDYYYNGSEWAKTETTFSVELNTDSDNGTTLQSGGFASIISNKTLTMPYTGLTGYVIPLPSSPISGELIFKIVNVRVYNSFYADYYNCFIKDLALSYQLEDGYSVDSDTDRIYENLTSACEVDRLDLTAGVSTAGDIIIGLNGTSFTIPVTTSYSTNVLLAAFLATQSFEGYKISYLTKNSFLTFTNKEYGTNVAPTIDFNSTGAAGAMSVSLAGFGTYFANELDEIDEKISSYNYDGLCYSKVLLNDDYLTDNLYSAIEDTTVRPEEALIRRIINFYSAPKIKLTQVLQYNDNICPLSVFVDSYMSDKTFLMMCGSIDYQDDKFTVIMVEQ
jgi:hypothetical protein